MRILTLSDSCELGCPKNERKCSKTVVGCLLVAVWCLDAGVWGVLPCRLCRGQVLQPGCGVSSLARPLLAAPGTEHPWASLGSQGALPGTLLSAGSARQSERTARKAAQKKRALKVILHLCSSKKGVGLHCFSGMSSGLIRDKAVCAIDRSTALCKTAGWGQLTLPGQQPGCPGKRWPDPCAGPGSPRPHV